MMKKFEEYVATLEPTQEELKTLAQLEKAIVVDSIAAMGSESSSMGDGVVKRSNGRRYKVNEKGQMERVR